MNNIGSTMSLKNLGLTLGPMVTTIFELFIYILNSPLLVFWVLAPVSLVRSLFTLFFAF